MNTVEGFKRVAENLQRRGFEVIAVPGWERRGVRTLTPKGLICHHTASNRKGGDTAALAICIAGRPGLANCLCNFHLSRSGVIRLVAARQAWHAGRGAWRGLRGNPDCIGVEPENDGIGEPWDPRLLRAYWALAAECAAVFGFPVDNVIGHREWTPRKPDPAGINMPEFRQQVIKAMSNVDPGDDELPSAEQVAEAIFTRKVGRHSKPFANLLEEIRIDSADALRIAQEALDLVRELAAKQEQVEAPSSVDAAVLPGSGS